MPNGGSDCCGTCWFNRTNRGEREWLEHRDESIPPPGVFRCLEDIRDRLTGRLGNTSVQATRYWGPLYLCPGSL